MVWRSIDEASPTSRERKRLSFLALFTFFLFTLLILQYYKIQIREGEKWTRLAEAQHKYRVVEPAQRGTFYSNSSIKAGHPEKPQPFVVSVAYFHLFVDPSAVPSHCRDEIADELAVSLGLTREEKSKLRAQFDKHSRNRKLQRWIAIEAHDQIAHWWFAYARKHKIARNALYFVKDYKRSYPFGKMLGQVLHTLRDDGCAGTGGLEMLFHSLLKGKDGKRMMTRSVKHPLSLGEVMSLPEHGADIYLTINHYLQAIAEEEIARGVKRANAKGGWAILMHPETGEIYALAQYPFFDPADYRRFFNDPELLEHTKVKGCVDPYEPGSTIKPLTTAIFLRANQELLRRGEKPLFSPQEKVATANGHFRGRSKLIKDLRTHHYLNLYMAMQKSSDVYMARMIERVISRLGAKWYREELQELFGFGKKTGIELAPESPGMLPQLGKTYANGALEWSLSTPYSLSYGYNLLVNSFQMLRNYALLANGGFDVQPKLVRKIVKARSDGSEEVLLDRTTSSTLHPKKRVLDAAIVQEVVNAMRYATTPGGSAARADIYGYTEVGKTGTAEKLIGGHYSQQTHFCSFIGFAPVKNPQFVLLIAIDEPEAKYIPGVGKNHMGGMCCAPVFREIGSRVLQYLGVEPDDPYGYPPGDPRHHPEKGAWTKECHSLKLLYNEWNSQ